MRGGLICITFSLLLDQNSDWTKSHISGTIQLILGVSKFGQGMDMLDNVTGIKVKGQISQGDDKACDIGRWAHVNTKLHFLLE